MGASFKGLMNVYYATEHLHNEPTHLFMNQCIHRLQAFSLATFRDRAVGGSGAAGRAGVLPDEGPPCSGGWGGSLRGEDWLSVERTAASAASKPQAPWTAHLQAGGAQAASQGVGGLAGSARWQDRLTWSPRAPAMSTLRQEWQDLTLQSNIHHYWQSLALKYSLEKKKKESSGI